MGPARMIIGELDTQRPAKARESDPIRVGSRDPAPAGTNPLPALGGRRRRLTVKEATCKFFPHVTSNPKSRLRLGVVSGWYSTKVSGTFVTGPHTTQEDCLSKILELNPPPAKKKFPTPG